MEPISLKVKRALSRLSQTGNPLFTKPLKNWTDEDFSLAKSFLRTARVEEDYTMEDLKKIQEFFSKPLEEMMSIDDQAKAYFLEKFKKGEIDYLPDNPKAAFLDQMMKDEMEKDAAQFRSERDLEEINDPRIGNPKFGKAPQQFADLRAKLGDETLLDKIQMIDVNSLRNILDELDSYNLQNEAKEEDAVDTITMDVPLFLRMLEYSREDASQDMDLHDVTEKAVELSKGKEYLSMEDYSEIVKAAEEVKEGMGGQLDERYFIEVSVRDAQKAIDIFDDQYSDSNIKMYGSNVYASDSLDSIYDFYYDLTSQDIEILDSSDFDEDDYEEEDYEETDYMKRRGGDYSDDEFEQSDYMRRRMGMDEVTKSFGERFPKDKLKDYIGKTINYYGNRFIVKDVDEVGTLTLVDAEDGEERMVNYNMFIQKGLIPELKKKIQETIKLGKGMIEEELCPKGKAYIKKRKAAGEKSSAYLSGRAVKVCKGQIKG